MFWIFANEIKFFDLVEKAKRYNLISIEKEEFWLRSTYTYNEDFEWVLNAFTQSRAIDHS